MNNNPDSNISSSELFHAVMDKIGVTPTDDRVRTTPDKPKPPVNPTSQQKDDQLVLKESLQMSPDHSIHEIEENESCRKDRLNPKDFRTLKRGKFRIDDYIDLHGHTVEEARKMIIQFIRESVSSGNQCVRIVHGKGRQSYNGIPKIKHMTHELLNQHKDVLGYCKAIPSDGGSGATYVLLVKPRTTASRR